MLFMMWRDGRRHPSDYLLVEQAMDSTYKNSVVHIIAPHYCMKTVPNT
jgi:hypothetical protein